MRQKSSRAVSPPDSASVGLQAFFAAEQHLAEQAVDVLARRRRGRTGAATRRRSCPSGSRRCGPAGSSRPTPRGPSAPCPRRCRPATARRPGASASSAFSSVVLPTPLRPTSTIFSPRLTMAPKSVDDRLRRRSAFDDALELERRCRPDGRFIANLMYGRWMFDRASSVVCRRSTSLRRDCTWLERVPAEKRAMKSLQLRDLLLALRVLGLDPRPDLRLGHHHVVVAAGVGDDRLVVDVGDVRADRVQEVAVVRDDDQRAVVADEEVAAASGSSRGRGGWSARRAAAPAGCRTAPAPAARAPSGRPAARPSSARAARRGCPGPAAGWRRRSRPRSRPPRRRCPRARRGACRRRRSCSALRVEHARAPRARAHRRCVAHDHRVDDAEVVEGELVLPQHAELLGPRRPCPSAAASSPVSSFMKVDLPAPFGPVRP